MSDQLFETDKLMAKNLTRRKMLKYTSLLGAGAAGAWLLAACAEDDDAADDDDTDAATDDTETEEEDDDEAADDTEDADEEVEDEEADDEDDTEDEDEAEDESDDDSTEDAEGAEIVVGLGTEPIELDPHRLTANIDRQTQRSVFSGLTRWDIDMAPQPDLAESWEITDDEQLVWSFSLREGVMFHNGREMTAEDVKFSIERIFEIGASGKYASYIREVESVEVVDDYTVEMTLAHPSGVLLVNLGVASIVPEEEAENLSETPVGTGPFSFVERIANQHIRLEKNEDYYGDWAADYPDVLTLTPAIEEQTRMANLSTGEIHYSQTVPYDRIEEIEGEEGIELIGMHPGSASYTWTLMHNQRPPFDDVNARLAVAYGTDREAFLEAIYRGNGEAHWNPFPQGHWAHADDIEGPVYDIDRAREYLEQSAYDGEEIVFKIFTQGVWGQFGELMHAMLQDIGFNVTLEQLEFATWIEQVYQQHDFQIAQTSLAREWDPDGLTISALTTDGSNNPGEYSNPEMDAAFERGRQAVDQEERIEAYREVQRIYAEDQPHVKAVNINSVGGYRSDAISEFNRDALGLTRYEFVSKS